MQYLCNFGEVVAGNSVQRVYIYLYIEMSILGFKSIAGFSCWLGRFGEIAKKSGPQHLQLKFMEPFMVSTYQDWSTNSSNWEHSTIEHHGTMGPQSLHV